jgi:carboxyl-terminal processing protease
MKRFFRDVLLGVLFILCLALTFALGYYVRALTAESFGLTWNLPGLRSTESYPLLTQIRQLLDQYYIAAEPDPQKLEYGAAHGLVNAVGDPFTVFVEPESHELETQSLQGEYGGVGMSLALAQSGEIVLTPFPDSPAAQGGLVEGDVLLAIDATPVTNTLKIDDVVALVRGPVGTSVSLTVRHASGETVTVRLTRQTFAIPSVTSKIISDTVPIGLIAVSRFSGKTPDEVRQAAASLRAKGAARYILDLRNNGGGILESGVDVAALFLDGGVVMYETQKGQPERIFSAPANSGPLATAPLAVLVNHGTASAAEIVSGALLDRGRAPLIGQKTYGKGSVQLVFDLPAGASLHVTAYLWYTPTHRALDKNGLPPTLAVEPATDGGDAEVARAVEYFHTISP